MEPVLTSYPTLPSLELTRPSLYLYNTSYISELLRRRSNKSQGGGASLILVIVVGLIGLILGYILKK
ncbi:hypothetical protein Hanom_Chr04g00311191 [Helianthus anomalus]